MKGKLSSCINFLDQHGLFHMQICVKYASFPLFNVFFYIIFLRARLSIVEESKRVHIAFAKGSALERWRDNLHVDYFPEPRLS